jgi:hypothetical protein
MWGWGEPDPVFRALQQLVEAAWRESIPIGDSLQQHGEQHSDPSSRPLLISFCNRLSIRNYSLPAFCSILAELMRLFRMRYE